LPLCISGTLPVCDASFRICIASLHPPFILRPTKSPGAPIERRSGGPCLKRWPMMECGTTTFTDPDDYRANLPGPAIDLVLTSSERFRARVTWLKLAQLGVLQVEERAPRIAFLSLPAASIFVSFPMSGDPPAVWNGVALRPGQLVLHGAGDRFHHRIEGVTRWGTAWLPRTALLAYGRALLGADLVLPATEIVLAPSSAIARFRRLQAQACRLVQNKPDVASHPEITRALEQDLVHALVNAIAAHAPRRAPRRALGDADLRRRHHADTMGRLEQTLASRPGRPPSISELSAAVGAPSRTLRMLCAEFLGMSPLAYARLRRLNLARLALMRTNPGEASVAGVARKFGFSELGRFAASYRAVFGEAPSATLRDAARLLGAADFGTVR
jgi:AraC-like DNA-binding protein